MSELPKTKQIVVVNMAVPMPFGQLAAQISHASMLSILNSGLWTDTKFTIETMEDPDLRYWMREHFTLIVCKVWGAEAIKKLASEATRLGIRNATMTDYGHVTAIALGPDSTEKLKVFNKLTLL